MLTWTRIVDSEYWQCSSVQHGGGSGARWEPVPGRCVHPVHYVLRMPLASLCFTIVRRAS